MSIFGRLEQRMAYGQTGALADSWYQPGGFFYGGLGPQTKSGTAISEYNAMQLAVVWCCIKILSEDSASLPLHLYQRLPGGGKVKAVDHPLYRLLHDSPNPEMTAFTFREAMKAHILAWGNGYAEKVYGKGKIGRDVIEQLWPITPNRVTVKRNKGEKKDIPIREIYYHVSMGGTGLPDVELTRRQVLHVPGLSFNGLVGYSVIAAHREAIGFGKALEEYGELYFGNGIHPSFVISMAGTLKDPAAFRAATNEVYGGLGKSHRVMLLEEAMKVEKLGIPNDEAQFLETRKYTNIDIGSRIYRLPPQMYGEYDKASTYASAEQFSLDYVVKTLRPWLVRLEQSFNMCLLSPDERQEYFYEHLIDGLMRGDAAARSEYYTKMFAIGGITVNEINELENRNPIGPDGDKRFVPLNMIPLEDAGKAQEPLPAKQKNSLIYRQRLENAYRRIFVDATERVIRKEVKAIRRLAEKHANNWIAAAFAEFYREMPEYIQKQIMPACLSYSEAFLGMEEELNGLKFDDFRAKLDVFVRDFAAKYADGLAERNLGELQSSADINKTLSDWEEERAYMLANEQISELSEAIKGAI
ncbi:MAG: Phage portal protein [Syntrophorhabdus sp. PtaU1.Bin153]|nr:MAG: Phage portal protein [Syntrophorhabdus sp. PtaU1.Bin153]